MSEGEIQDDFAARSSQLTAIFEVNYPRYFQRTAAPAASCAGVAGWNYRAAELVGLNLFSLAI